MTFDKAQGISVTALRRELSELRGEFRKVETRASWQDLKFISERILATEAKLASVGAL